MDDERKGGAEESIDGAGPDAASDSDDAHVADESSAIEQAEDVPPELNEAEAEAEAEIVDLPWDDDLPVALGEETDVADTADPVHPGGTDDPEGDADDADLGDLPDYDHLAARRNALPRRVESWRTRSASGAIATAIAMGLQQVFEPERKRPAAVAEAPSDPYADDDPVTVDYVPDDAEATRVHVKPWLLQKGDPS